MSGTTGPAGAPAGTGEKAAPSTIRRVAGASLVGTMVEWYDYFIFGTASAIVFNRIFFPDLDPAVGTLAAFATLGVGFLARPLGAVVIGHYGDRIGRKSMLVLTLLVMGVATFAIGLLPTYATIGIWAPVLLVFLRLVQGFGVGGEWGGAVLMVVEHSPPRQRGFWGTFPQIGNALGLISATGIFALFALLPEEQFLSWGWRIPFLFSAVMLAVGLYIRLAVAESPSFEKLKREQQQVALPIVEVFRTQWRSILTTIGLRSSEGVFSYIILTFALSYATGNLDLPRTPILLATTVAAAFIAVAYPLFGLLSDRVGRRPVYLFGALFTLVFAFPFTWLLESGSMALLWLAMIIGYVFAIGSTYAVQPALFSELFSTKVRYTGISVGQQLASVVTSGLAPTVAAALTLWAGGALWPVAVYVAASAVITIATVAYTRETYRGAV
ncbi:MULTISPECIES: MFS transporter [unclassified Pseudonocardia]|uniref:MFS transporter n=1 Tax=unclassified Pseudonocardia TaxID=2619320 RepID=UPI0001FFEFAE|nr:MFS transporter [Pseudonocardia sp. Ae707_Ps1]OLM18286.1 permease of the major facilitator superfamily [Pseudonocardia sp. Ae707_Ps1]